MLGMAGWVILWLLTGPNAADGRPVVPEPLRGLLFLGGFCAMAAALGFATRFGF